MLAEIGHLVNDNLFITVKSFYNRIIFFIHYMDIYIFLQIV